MPGDLPSVLTVQVKRLAAQSPVKVPPSLQKNYRLAKEEARKRVAERECRKYKEAVRRDALQHVNLVVLITAAELNLVGPVTHVSEPEKSKVF